MSGRNFFSRHAGILLAAAGLCLMVFGISRGEMSVVFDKAVRICMELSLIHISEPTRH